jgi:hypothetical protein
MGAGSHIPFPAIGHVLSVGKGFQFVPPNYATEPATRGVDTQRLAVR